MNYLIICLLIWLPINAIAQDLNLAFQRHSLHSGETVICHVELTQQGLAKINRNMPMVLWNGPFSIMEVPLLPEKVGVQQFGPVYLTLFDTVLTSSVARLEVLPNLGTNTVAEIRVLDRRIQLGQTLEVVFQWQQPMPFPSMTNQVPLPEEPPASRREDVRRWGWSGPPWAEAGDWDVNIDVDHADLSRIVRRGSDSYLLNAGFQVYTLRPRRAGQLEITEKVFRVFPVEFTFKDLPLVFKIDPIAVMVEKAANQVPEDPARKLADPQH
jgi:hypothetical protein